MYERTASMTATAGALPFPMTGLMNLPTLQSM